MTVIYAGAKADENGYSTGLVVHDTGRIAVSRARAEMLVKRLNPLLGVGIFFAGPFLVLLILYNLTRNGDAGGWYLLFGFIGCSLYLLSRLKGSNSVVHAIVRNVRIEAEKAIEHEKARASAG